MASIVGVPPYTVGAAVRAPAAVLWSLGAAGCAAAAASLTLALTNDVIGVDVGEPLVIALLSVNVTLSYVLCGLVALSRRPESRFGALLIVAGFANFASTLSWAQNDIPFTVGQSLDLLPPVLFLHVFLAFPSGRLTSRLDRAVVLAAYVTAISLELVRMTFGGFGPHNLLEVAARPEAGLVVLRVQLVAVSAFCLIGVGILAHRRRRSGRPLRRSATLLVDAFALGLVMIAVLFVSAAFGGPLVQEIRWATFVALSLAPIAFLFGLLHSRLARSAVGELVVELREEPEPEHLRDAVARALRDPSLTIAYWLPQFGSWADLDGRAVHLPHPGDARVATPLEGDGERSAVLLHDPALRDEPELLDAVRAAASISLRNARLQVELRARLEELRGSRARIVEAGHRERQRLERNLHDGAQQRLIALSLELSLLEDELRGDPRATERLEQARHEIAASLEELREIAHGLHPAVVSGHGLDVALEQLAARAPVPVRLNVAVKGRLPEPLEVAAYYVVAEALANVGKYAMASSATVDVSRTAGLVVVEVVDDGVGGADTEGGSGLRGLADRVEALGGRLRIWSPRGGGTRVQAEVPCAP